MSRGVNIYPERENEVHLQLDTMHLAPGRYKIDIIGYQYNEYGKELFLDGVYPGIMLEILETLNEDNKLIWNSRFWGHVHLNDVRVVE